MTTTRDTRFLFIRKYFLFVPSVRVLSSKRTVCSRVRVHMNRICIFHLHFVYFLFHSFFDASARVHSLTSLVYNVLSGSIYMRRIRTQQWTGMESHVRNCGIRMHLLSLPATLAATRRADIVNTCEKRRKQARTQMKRYFCFFLPSFLLSTYSQFDVSRT